MTGFEEEIITGEQPENFQDFEQKRLQQNEKRTEEAGNSISDRTEGKTSKYDNQLTHVDDVLKNKLGFLFDHPYNALILTTEADEKERKEEASVGAESDMYGNSEIVVEWEVVHQQQSEQNKDIPEEWISEYTEGHGSNLTLGSRCEQEQLVQLSCVSDFQHIAETNVVDNRDDPRTLTAFPFNGRMPGGIDTFQRIQLSLDGDEDDLSKSPLLTGLAGQLLTSPQQQLHEHEEVPQEEEEETSGHHTENKAKGFSGIHSMCNEVPNCISAAAAGDIALVRPKTHNSPECFQEDLTAQSVSSSVPSNSDGSGSDEDDCLKFEKKELFDKVMKELNLFFEISISDFTRDSGASSSEQCVHVTEALDRDNLNSKEDLSIPELGCYRDPSPDDVKEDSGLEMCAEDADVSPACEGEQEVPLGTHLCTKETHKEPPQRKRWSPSFLGPPLLEQLGYRQPEQTRRLQPLRTCNRPIRVGLSKRAKTKQLHPTPPRPTSDQG
ncbi:uncharacterized protein LOC119194947 [Pungitius pungitius]|uniref:uncharacterized protein LOC119194947 n=1 Tax=Pungitius pungitius TaxID=134920 RepID=UPI002E0D9D38